MQHAEARTPGEETGADRTDTGERLDVGGRLTLLETRVAELEAQVAALEEGRDAAPSLEAVLGRFVPPEVIGHMKSARREDMLALRSLLDAWIARLDRERGSGSGSGFGSADGPSKGRRETIVLE